MDSHFAALASAKLNRRQTAEQFLRKADDERIRAMYHPTSTLQQEARERALLLARAATEHLEEDVTFQPTH